MQNIFSPEVVQSLIVRLNHLQPNQTPLWGKMTVGQMLAHCNVTYEMAYENIHPKPNAMLRLVLKWFVKNGVVNDKLYKKNSPTAPAFIMKESKDVEKERLRLIQYLQHTLSLGKAHFEGKESLSFGTLTSDEWNNMFYKHIDHHLKQFGV
ncbi:MAG: DUF1569 domain-containing protein [Cytophagaceae bacterium]|nr:DUF1569 domain-containing protein [Cytophagaceae bacterium]